MPTCKHCHEEFVLRPDHEGFANVCPNCSSGDVDRVMAKVAWSGKHTVEIEITSNRREAQAFNNAQKRIGGQSPLRVMCGGRESIVGREASKKGSGAEKGAGYTTSLGERRSVKR